MTDNSLFCPHCLGENLDVRIDKHNRPYLSCKNRKCAFKAFGVSAIDVALFGFLTKIFRKDFVQEQFRQFLDEALPRINKRMSPVQAFADMDIAPDGERRARERVLEHVKHIAGQKQKEEALK